MERDLSFYQRELARLLSLSTLTPGEYRPSEDAKRSWHAAVYVGTTPVVLCGPHDDPDSIEQTMALAESGIAATLFRSAGYEDDIWTGIVHGEDIDWNSVESAIVSKPSGQIEHGDGTGPLIAIVLNDERRALAPLLCVMTETARALDPEAPELDNGQFLPMLARCSRLVEPEGPAPGSR